jgi:hypothetical protein
MTLPAFRLLPLDQQYGAVFATGHYLARRWQAADEAVHLYELPGRFWVELPYDVARNDLVDLLAFGPDEPDRLADYAASVRLPDWMPGTE